VGRYGSDRTGGPLNEHDASVALDLVQQSNTCDYASPSPNRYTRIFDDRNRPSFSRVPGTCLGGGLAYQDVAVSSVAVRGLITNAFSMCIGKVVTDSI
jgi:hypothetical protein